MNLDMKSFKSTVLIEIFISRNDHKEKTQSFKLNLLFMLNHKCKRSKCNAIKIIDVNRITKA